MYRAVRVSVGSQRGLTHPMQADKGLCCSRHRPAAWCEPRIISHPRYFPCFVTLERVVSRGVLPSPLRPRERHLLGCQVLNPEPFLFLLAGARARTSRSSARRWWTWLALRSRPSLPSAAPGRLRMPTGEFSVPPTLFLLYLASFSFSLAAAQCSQTPRFRPQRSKPHAAVGAAPKLCPATERAT